MTYSRHRRYGQAAMKTTISNACAAALTRADELTHAAAALEAAAVG